MLRARIQADEKTGGPLAPFDPGVALSDRLGGALARSICARCRADDGSRVLVTLVVQRGRVATRTRPSKKRRASLASEAPAIIGVAVNFHEGDSPQILGTETSRRARRGVGGGPHRPLAPPCDLRLVRAGASRPGRARPRPAGRSCWDWSARVRTASPRPRVLDLYGGSGAIALVLGARRRGRPSRRVVRAAADASGARGAVTGAAGARRGRGRRRPRCAGSTSRAHASTPWW